MTLTSAAQRIYDRWEPYWQTDAENGLVLQAIADAVGENQQPIDDVARDTDTHEAWHALFDPFATPVWALGWLAQIVGVKPVPADTELQARDRIAQAAGFYRGTQRAIREEVQRTLAGTKTVRIIKTGAWALSVIVKTSETPDATAAQRAARAQKPAGVILSFAVSDEPYIDEGTELINSVAVTIDAPPTLADVT